MFLSSGNVTAAWVSLIFSKRVDMRTGLLIIVPKFILCKLSLKAAAIFSESRVLKDAVSNKDTCM